MRSGAVLREQCAGRGAAFALSSRSQALKAFCRCCLVFRPYTGEEVGLIHLLRRYMNREEEEKPRENRRQRCPRQASIWRYGGVRDPNASKPKSLYILIYAMFLLFYALAAICPGVTCEVQQACRYA